MAAARTRSRFDREEARPQNDVYTGLLAISLIAMITSCILLFLDYKQYGDSKAPSVQRADPAAPPKPLSQGQLPPPPPLEDRPMTRAADSNAPGLVLLPEPSPAPTSITPVGGLETPGSAPLVPAGGDAPAKTPGN